MKYHIKRGFRPAAPHCSDETLCGLRIKATTLLCHYAKPSIIGSQRDRFYIWINSRHMIDIDETQACKTCTRIIKGDSK